MVVEVIAINHMTSDHLINYHLIIYDHRMIIS